MNVVVEQPNLTNPLIGFTPDDEDKKALNDIVNLNVDYMYCDGKVDTEEREKRFSDLLLFYVWSLQQDRLEDF